MKFQKYEASHHSRILSIVADKGFRFCASGCSGIAFSKDFMGRCGSASGKRNYYNYHDRTNMYISDSLTSKEIHDIKFNRDLKEILDE